MEWMNSRFAQSEQARKSMFLEHIAQEQRCPCWLASWPLSWGHSPVSTMAKQILMLAYQQLMPRTPWRPELPWPGPTFSDRLHKLWLFLNEMCLFFVTSSWVLIESPSGTPQRLSYWACVSHHKGNNDLVTQVHFYIKIALLINKRIWTHIKKFRIFLSNIFLSCGLLYQVNLTIPVETRW